MRLVTFISSMSLSIFLARCNKKPDEVTQIPEGVPVETEAPNTRYKPSFEGQTRIPSVKTKTPIDSEILNNTLTKPWGITSLPDGRLLITQKAGTLLIADPSGKVSAEIIGLRSK